jgi:quercetin dioxygenase-like cupin family protein
VARLEVSGEATRLEPGYPAPFCSLAGGAKSSYFHPPGYSLWLLRAELGEGATVSWAAVHGDESVFVLDGSVTCEDTTCPRGGMVVVEANVATELRADEPTTILHVGPTDPAPPVDGLLGPADPNGHRVHVLQPSDAVFVGDNIGQGNFMDSTCPTCRISVFYVDCKLPGYTAASHTHSEDEIIHVLTGHLRIGPQLVETGMSVAVPKDRRYGFTSDVPFSFFNYRRDVSTMTFKPGSDPWLETLESLREFMATHPDGNVEGVAAS